MWVLVRFGFDSIPISNCHSFFTTRHSSHSSFMSMVSVSMTAVTLNLDFKVTELPSTYCVRSWRAICLQCLFKHTYITGCHFHKVWCGKSRMDLPEVEKVPRIYLRVSTRIIHERGGPTADRQLDTAWRQAAIAAWLRWSGGGEKSRFSTISLYFGNDTRQGRSCNGVRMRSVECCHFQLPWITSNLDFKVTIFFNVKYTVSWK